MKYEIRQVDALNVYGEGWHWNTSYKIGEFTTHSTDHKRAFLHALHKNKIVLKRGKTVVIDDGEIFEVQDRRTQQPLFAAIPVA